MYKVFRCSGQAALKMAVVIALVTALLAGFSIGIVPTVTAANQPGPSPADAEIGQMTTRAAADTLWVNASTGDDTAAGTANAELKTLEAALAKAAAEPTVRRINITGEFKLDKTIIIPDGITLAVTAAGATFSADGNKLKGIVLSKGATLTGSGEMQMRGFATALTAEAGSLITDGIYNFQDNGVEDGTGVSFGGKVKGSGDKNKLRIMVNDICSTDFYNDGSSFENCIVNVNSQKRTWFDARNLTLKNADFTVAGFGMGYYIGTLDMENSSLTVNKGSGWRCPTGFTIQGDKDKESSVRNSKITVNAGTTAGISIGLSDKKKKITFKDSTLELNNSGVGGLNINTGSVELISSTIISNGKQSGAVFGAQGNGEIIFKDNCLVKTPANKAAHTGSAQNKNTYIVLGGSYLVTYAPDYHAGDGSTIPNNGAANGNEPLSLFTLSDPTQTLLQPLNRQGKPYDYSVTKPSSDGQKHVWVPAAKVQFYLNDPTSAAPVKDVCFSDGSTTAKTASAMRGYPLNAAVKIAGGNTQLPSQPQAAGYKFKGWFYKNLTDNSEQPFNEAIKVPKDLDVYAKWEKDPNAYLIKYNNAAADNKVLSMAFSNPQRTFKVLSLAAVKAQSPAFVPDGKVFRGWATRPDAAAPETAAGKVITLPGAKNIYNLYAIWENKLLTVKFSANGGIFTKQSIFKARSDIFSIDKDSAGGEVAVIKKTPAVVDKMSLVSLLQTLDPTIDLAKSGLVGFTNDPDDKVLKEIATRQYNILGTFDKQVGFFLRKHYYYWFNDPDGKQCADLSKDTALTDDTTFYLKWQQNPNIPTINAECRIPADMWSKDPGQTTRIKNLNTSGSFAITGAVDATEIVHQMNSLEGELAKNISDLSQIKLTQLSSVFKARLTLPVGVVLPANPTVQAAGLGNCFEVDSVKAGSTPEATLDVTFKLKQGISNYKQLKEAVESTGVPQPGYHPWMPKPLTFTVTGLTCAPGKFTNLEEFTATGTVEGNFSAYATDMNSNATKKFTFTWKGEQITEAKDTNKPGITQTFRCLYPLELPLPADMAVNNNTEHDAVIELTPGATFPLTGALQVEPIHEQMAKIEAAYPGEKHDQIALSDIDFGFTASFTAPDDISLPRSLSPADIKCENFGTGFKVDSVNINGQTVTLEFSLNNTADVRTYTDLEKVVDPAGGESGWMRLTVPNLKIKNDAPLDQNFTIIGKVNGRFAATAVSAGGEVKYFAFKWQGEQWPDGKDAIATTDDVISLTVKAVSSPKPGLITPPASFKPIAPPTEPDLPKVSGRNMPPRSAGVPLPKTGEAAPPWWAALTLIGGLPLLALGLILRKTIAIPGER
ncbi:repeat protein [Mageeibacillus indolicus UPII9-5]|uniref:Repeat protein n=1 Tax=Mageeibacillus indolicus (strain UPII9-5) TaxID=699246 RepID=D3R035_MAGIU|nr:InlB B-repeat-containing protein [Mageeibacillus indolicus]ADC90468.1 repeat protein [Mageeibacillus indolicus UPII9-5]